MQRSWSGSLYSSLLLAVVRLSLCRDGQYTSTSCRRDRGAAALPCNDSAGPGFAVRARSWRTYDPVPAPGSVAALADAARRAGGLLGQPHSAVRRRDREDRVRLLRGLPAVHDLGGADARNLRGQPSLL